MYKVYFDYRTPAMFAGKSQEIIVPGLEPAVALASLLDRISRSLPDQVMYVNISLVPIKDQKNETSES